jgi:octaprenyl-diphosphate synthase
LSALKEKILAAVSPDLAAIEDALTANLTPHLELVRDVAGHIIFAGGKRLRPLLMVLAARICGYQGDYDKTFSSALEYLHAATLLHDDLVDGASLRRGKPAAHLNWGNSIAVLVGDFLLARALSISAGTGSLEVVRILSELTENMSQGEVHQLLRKGDPGLTEEEYHDVIRRKTALLFEAACRVSAVLAGAPPEKERALADYGINLGMAFQIADDLFDYTLDSSQWGKTIGADLREGKVTLPLILTLRNTEASERDWTARLIKEKRFSEDDFRRLLELMRQSGAIDYTRKAALGFIGKAKRALSAFEASATRQTLLDIADYALERSL